MRGYEATDPDDLTWDMRFWETVQPIKDEMEAVAIPYVMEAAGKYELVQAMARALLNGCSVKPSLWSQCVRNLSIRFGLHGDEIEYVVGLQMLEQLQVEHDWANTVDELSE